MKAIFKIILLGFVVIAYWFIINVIAEMDFSSPPELNLTELEMADCWWENNSGQNYSIDTLNLTDYYTKNITIFCRETKESLDFIQPTGIGHSLVVTVTKKRFYGRIYGTDSTQDLYLFNTPIIFPWKKDNFEHYPRVHLIFLLMISFLFIFWVYRGKKRKLVRYTELPELPKTYKGDSTYLNEKTGENENIL